MTGIAFRHLYSATVSIDHSTANLEKVLKREKDVGRGSERVEDGQAFHRLGRVMAMDLAGSWVFCGPNHGRPQGGARGSICSPLDFGHILPSMHGADERSLMGSRLLAQVLSRTLTTLCI